MSSDSDDSLELLDIQWDEPDRFFDYNDPFSVSPQLSAVLDDDVPRLESLLASGKSVNINDNCGNTPLHVAVLKQKRKIFDYLLSRDDLRIDAANFEGFTPLMLAVIYCEDYYAFKLIENEADVNINNNSGASPLHYAFNKLPIAQKLVEKGAKIDTQDGIGETPLYVGCDKGCCDFIHFLLYCGADPMLPNDLNFLPFTVSMLSCPIDVQEILFYLTYDNDSEVSVQTLTLAMKTESPFFDKLANMCHVVYKENDLRYLKEHFLSIKPEIFKVFVEEHEHLVRHFFVMHDPLTPIFENYSEQNERFFYMLFESHLRQEIVSNLRTCLSSYINFDTLSEDSLTKLLCYILSYGVDITSFDMNMIYRFYGFGQCFKLLLHMRIVEHVCFKRMVFLGEFLMPRLIYDFGLKINVINEISPTALSLRCFEDLVKFFAHPHLIEFSKFKKIPVNLPNVPSLLQLSRECVRENLIKQYNITNNSMYHTVLDRLPIFDDFKAILRYEKPIYYN